jgi:orotate phosphoribosyltransferase
MVNDKRVCELLVETGAFKDLEQPVILTSGELGIYYINAEKLCMDGGKFNDFGDDSEAMSKHAFNMMKEHPGFDEVISALAGKAGELLENGKGSYAAISGGQRRDWIFSCPVAEKLNVPHLSLYKQVKGQPDKIELLIASEKLGDGPIEIKDFNIVHIVDMITEGSSIYRIEEGKEMGWVPMIRDRSSNGSDSIKNVLAVVSRNQGGEKTLSKQGINVNSLVSIDNEFLNGNSRYAERDIEYLRDPKGWSESFLYNNSIDCLVQFFDPKGGKIDRAKKFLVRYNDYMKKIGASEELSKKVNTEYNYNIADLG